MSNYSLHWKDDSEPGVLRLSCPVDDCNFVEYLAIPAKSKFDGVTADNTVGHHLIILQSSHPDHYCSNCERHHKDGECQPANGSDDNA
jgi:hypothetical protein